MAQVSADALNATIYADYDTRWLHWATKMHVFGFAGTNPCGSSNGGCQYICLLSAEASDGYTCACPDDLIRDSNGRDCSSKHIVSISTTHESFTIKILSMF